MQFEIYPSNPPNDGIMFVDHSKSNRSGHLGHALVEYEDGRILAFYANCSADRKGHTADGWMECKRSLDGGESWSDPVPLEYSKALYDSGQGRSAMSEKAVRTEDGAIVLFNLVCDISENTSWEPYMIPTFLRSVDGGETWTEAKPLSDKRGRVYDAILHEGEILALEFCNDAVNTWTGNLPEHQYHLYASADGGKTFSLRSVLPFDTKGRGYGAMAVLPDGGLIAYAYNIADEQRLDYVVSHDCGSTWSAPNTAFLQKKIRNPQMAAFKGGYVLHGRSGNKGEGSGHFVLYTSQDGVTWDAGQYLRMQEARLGAYSNNLLVGALNPGKENRLLIQASHAYEDSKTNILHWWLR